VKAERNIHIRAKECLKDCRENDGAIFYHDGVEKRQLLDKGGKKREGWEIRGPPFSAEG